MIAIALEETLEEMGHTVCASAGTEPEAIAAAFHSVPDLMIVDARLRVGSGIAAMQKILTERFVPHIYVSGDSLIAEGLENGAIILRKPFSDEDLAVAIARAMDSALTHTPSGDDPQRPTHDPT